MVSKRTAIKHIKNLQCNDTIYPWILDSFPDGMKGSIAKTRWNDTEFRYGTEYGMLAILMYIFNITEEDLKCPKYQKNGLKNTIQT